MRGRKPDALAVRRGTSTADISTTTAVTMEEGYLDNTDTVFGQVYEGMDVVDRIACVDTVTDEEGNDTFPNPTSHDTS